MQFFVAIWQLIFADRRSRAEEEEEVFWTLGFLSHYGNHGYIRFFRVQVSYWFLFVVGMCSLATSRLRSSYRTVSFFSLTLAVSSNPYSILDGRWHISECLLTHWMILEWSVPPFGEEASTLFVVEVLVVRQAARSAGCVVCIRYDCRLWCHDYCDSIALWQQRLVDANCKLTCAIWKKFDSFFVLCLAWSLFEHQKNLSTWNRKMVKSGKIEKRSQMTQPVLSRVSAPEAW